MSISPRDSLNDLTEGSPFKIKSNHVFTKEKNRYFVKELKQD